MPIIQIIISIINNHKKKTAFFIFIFICYQILTGNWFLKKIISTHYLQTYGISEIDSISISFLFQKISFKGISFESQKSSHFISLKNSQITIYFSLSSLLFNHEFYIQKIHAKVDNGSFQEKGNDYSINFSILEIKTNKFKDNTILQANVTCPNLTIYSKEIKGELQLNQINSTIDFSLTNSHIIQALIKKEPIISFLPTEIEVNIHISNYFYSGKDFLIPFSREVAFPQDFHLTASLKQTTPLTYLGNFQNETEENSILKGNFKLYPFNQYGILEAYLCLPPKITEIYKILNISGQKKYLKFLYLFNKDGCEHQISETNFLSL